MIVIATHTAKAEYLARCCESDLVIAREAVVALTWKCATHPDETNSTIQSYLTLLGRQRQHRHAVLSLFLTTFHMPKYYSEDSRKEYLQIHDERILWEANKDFNNEEYYILVHDILNEYSNDL